MVAYTYVFIYIYVFLIKQESMLCILFHNLLFMFSVIKSSHAILRLLHNYFELWNHCWDDPHGHLPSSRLLIELEHPWGGVYPLSQHHPRYCSLSISDLPSREAGPGEKRDKQVWGCQRSHSNDPLWPVLLLQTCWQMRKLISRGPWGQLCIWTKFTAEIPGAVTLCLPPTIPAGGRGRVLTTCSLPYLPGGPRISSPWSVPRLCHALVMHRKKSLGPHVHPGAWEGLRCSSARTPGISFHLSRCGRDCPAVHQIGFFLQDTWQDCIS